MLILRQLFHGILIAGIMTNSLHYTVPANNSSHLVRTAYIGSSSATDFVLAEESSSLLIIYGNQPYHYCTIMPDSANGGSGFDRGLANYQSMIYTSETASEFETIFSILEETGNLESIYIEVDPAKLAPDQYMIFTDFLKAHSSVRVTFCLPAYSNTMLKSMIDDRSFLNVVNSYALFSSVVLDFEQAEVIFPNQLFWVGADKFGFDENEHYTLDLAQAVAKSACLKECFVNRDSILTLYSSFISDTIRTISQRYPDLTGKSVAIFGDSINGNFAPLYSIANFMSSMSGATVYNFAIGGASAYSNPDDSNYSFCFETQVRSVLSRDLSQLQPDCLQHKSYENLPGNLNFDIILVEYGLNDYMNNFDIDDENDPYNVLTMKAGYRIGLDLLQEAYPDATIYIVLPNHISFFEYGTVQLCNNGDLDYYVDRIAEIAEEYDLPVIDCYHIPSWNKETLSLYSLDGIHPNVLGRYELARRYLLGL